MGYGIDLSRDAETNKKIEEGFFYRFYPDKGFAIDNANVATLALSIANPLSG